VHPTQIYESLCGLALFFVCLWQRKHQKFRGQIFFTFAFGYGFLRFILEMMRDDVERGEYGPMMQEHVLVPGALLLMSVGFAFGFAVAIRDAKVRLAARVVAFLPPVVAFIILQPPSFGSSESVMLSTSQWIGLLSALAVSAFYAQYYQAAKKAPKLAMGKASLGDFVPDPAPPSGDPLGVEAVAGADPTSEAGDEREDDDLDDLATADKARTLADAPRAKKKARDKRAPKADPAPPKQNATDAHDATDAADATAATAVRAKGPAEDAPQPVVAEGGASKPEPEPEAAPKAQG
jgi:phosphatidylglycerol:prolipoprotein diacylglycerol transferase